MTARSGMGGSAAGLTGRVSERGVLDQFIAGALAEATDPAVDPERRA